MAGNPRSFRLDEDLLKWLQSQADKERRSLNNYVEGVLIEYMEKKKKKQK